MLPGIYHDVSFDTYRRWDCFSKSMVNAALTSHAHLEAHINHPKKTKSLTLGSLIDCLVLEPQTFHKEYVEQPDTYPSEKTTGRAPNKITTIIEKPWAANANYCKDFAQQVTDEDKVLIDSKTLRNARSCQVSLHENEEIRAILDDGRKQVSIVWKCPHTGIMCKGRYDLLGENYESITDLKSADDASEDGFNKASAKYDYNLQGGIYTEAHYILTKNKLGFTNIVVETGKMSTMQPATNIFGYLYDDPLLKLGRLKFKRACEAVLEYSKKDGVYGYSKQTKMVIFPFGPILRCVVKPGVPVDSWRIEGIRHMQVMLEILRTINLISDTNPMLKSDVLNPNAYKVTFHVQDEGYLMYWLQMQQQVTHTISDIHTSRRHMRMSWTFTYRRPQGHIVELRFQTNSELMQELWLLTDHEPGDRLILDGYWIIDRLIPMLIRTGIFAKRKGLSDGKKY